MPGSATTLRALSGPWLGDGVEVVHAPSMRLAADAANPDRSLAVLPGGQSGHPFDRHYDDQIEAFLALEARPVAWSEERIAAGTVSTLVLAP